jgi:DNA ligase-1
MLFAEVAKTSVAVAAVSGRLEKVARLSELLRRLEPAELETAISWLSGEPRQGRIGVGHSTLASGSSAEASDSPTLTIAEVDAALSRLHAVAGKGAASRRVSLLRDLFARATRDEQDFLRRLLYGELRQGALEGVLTDAAASALSVDPVKLRRAAMITGDLAAAARAVRDNGAAALEAMAIRLMRPVQPMLADAGETLSEALETLGGAALEYKLDGARIQVHKDNDDVRIFSRSLRDVTAAAPEAVALVQSLPARRLILDGEVIALRADGTPHPFQVTMSRFGRAKGAGRTAAHLALTPFFFDCLYLDGAALLDEPHERRIQALDEIAKAAAVPRIVRPTSAAAGAFAREAVARGHEGIMAKALAAPYSAGRRGSAWLKLKQARALDLVVLAAEWGSGRRQGWLSNLHLGARDPEHGSFVMLGKTFKGMTDEMLTWQTARLLDLEIGRDAYVVFVRPELVVEVAFNEIQDSPVYPGGLALRFARVKRYRTDKMASDADTIDTVRRLAGRAGPDPE